MLIHESELSERKKHILKAIVDAHITLGEPVGSKYLAALKEISCSSATIRNEMAELEELGYLEQPHTSAGRIPSGMGYRFYVDSLLRAYRMTAGEIKKIDLLLQTKLSELDKILSQASRLASMMTNYTGIAVKPKPATLTVVRFEVIYVDGRNIILVMLTTSNTVKTKYIRLPFVITVGIAAELCATLNDCIADLPADSITLPLIVEMERRLGKNYQLIDITLKNVYATINEIDDGELRLQGVNRLLHYPEFSDMSRLRDLLELLEQKEEILNIISSASRDSVNVCIGSESEVDIMSNSTLVFKMVKNGERVVGAIGLLGPCRMDYSRAIAMIDSLATGVGNMLSAENSQ